MIKFNKFSVELSLMDAMALSEFLNLIGSNYELGDDLVRCISRFIHAVSDAGCKALPKDALFSSEVFDILGSDGTGKRIKY